MMGIVEGSQLDAPNNESGLARKTNITNKHLKKNQGQTTTLSTSRSVDEKKQSLKVDPRYTSRSEGKSQSH